MNISDIERNIINLIQEDASLTNQEIADRVGGSPTAVWRRIQRLEEKGIIRARVVLLDRRAVGLELCIICNVKLKRHTDPARQSFEALVSSRREIRECYFVSGEHDYVLIVLVRDVEAYERFLTQVLLGCPEVATAGSSLTLREIKYTTAVSI